MRMNLALLDTFGQSFPEEFDGALDCVALAVTCSFNRRGSLLAVGCNDGRVIIWDFLTRGIAKTINAHVYPVCSISWSRNGHELLTCSTDNTVSIWKVKNSELKHTYRFPVPILKVQFHTRASYKFLVCPMRHAAVMMDTNGEHNIIPVEDESDLNIVACFDRRGEFVYTGNGKGKILVFSVSELELCASFKITPSSTAIKQIEFGRRGECFLVNSADRIIRIYESREVLACGKDGNPEPMQKLQDLVNKTMWKRCCFSGDGEFVAAGSARQHSIYIWEKSSGTIVKDLHGTKGEMLLDIVWHPFRPILCSISSGVVSVWAQNQVENWSAFAPDFKELDENVEYEEREGEFDLEDEDKDETPSKTEVSRGSEDEDDVDVTTVEPVVAYISSDEETRADDKDDELIFLSEAPDVDNPEETSFTTVVTSSASNSVISPHSSEKHRSGSGGGHRRSSPVSATSSSKVTEVVLPDAHIGDIHPLIGPTPPSAAAGWSGSGSGSTSLSRKAWTSGSTGHGHGHHDQQHHHQQKPGSKRTGSTSAHTTGHSGSRSKKSNTRR